MENEHNAQQGFLTSLKEDEYPIFAEVDYLLRSGTHIQNATHQRKYYKFLKKYEPQLSAYYNQLFRLTLETIGEEDTDDKFYYIQVNQEGDNIGGMKSNRVKKFADERILFGVYLLYLYKVEKLFEKMVKKDDLVEQLTTDPNYKNQIA